MLLAVVGAVALSIGAGKAAWRDVVWLAARRAARRRRGHVAWRLGESPAALPRPRRSSASCARSPGSPGRPGCSRVWTLWRWRRRLASRHIVVPLAVAATLLAIWIAMAGSDRALHARACPPLAVLAAFALPTLKRSAAAAIDWFSVFFFTIAVATGWVFYVAMQTGTPASSPPTSPSCRPATRTCSRRLALALALIGTLAWLWLVRWRTGRHRHPLWKSLVLPAGGVSICWLLVMTLLLPPLDNARSYRSMVQRIARQVPAGGCIAAPGMARAQFVALEYLGGCEVDAKTARATTRCDFLILHTHAGSCQPRRGSSSRASVACAATTTSPTSIGASAPLSAAGQRPSPTRRATSSDASRRRGCRVTHAQRREDQPEGRALAGLAGDVELAAVTLHHVLDDRQARPVPPDSRERLPSTR